MTHNAKMKRDFSNPKKLGFMRFIMVSQYIQVTFLILSLIFLDLNQTALEPVDYLSMAITLANAVAIWLALNRKKALRPFMIAFAGVDMLVFALNAILSGDPITSILIGNIWNLILIAYFLTSRRVKVVMTHAFNETVEEEEGSTASNNLNPEIAKDAEGAPAGAHGTTDAEGAPAGAHGTTDAEGAPAGAHGSAPLSANLANGFKSNPRNQDGTHAFFRPRTWPFWRNLIIYFCVFSVVGHWLEALYCTFIRFGIIPGIYDPNSQIWSDWLYPFVVYGVGAVACVLLLFPIKMVLDKKLRSKALSLAISFAINALVCTLIELAMGLMLNQPDASGTYPLWDYSDMFMNFMGQVCLQNAIAFGLVATLMVVFIYPSLEQAFSLVNRSTMSIVFILVTVGFAILFALYCINVLIPDITVDANVQMQD